MYSLSELGHPPLTLENECSRFGVFDLKLMLGSESQLDIQHTENRREDSLVISHSKNKRQDPSVPITM